MSIEYILKANKTKVGNSVRKLLLINLADLANEKGYCYPSQRYLAEVCETSVKSIQRHIVVLMEMGLLRKANRFHANHKGQVSNAYFLTLDNCEKLSEDFRAISTNDGMTEGGGQKNLPQDNMTYTPSQSVIPPQDTMTEPPSHKVLGGYDTESYDPVIDTVNDPVKEPVKDTITPQTPHGGQVGGSERDFLQPTTASRGNGDFATEQKPKPKRLDAKTLPEVIAIFDHWRLVLDHPKAKLDDARAKKIHQAIRLGFSPDELKQAINGVKNSDFHMGNNDRGKRYDGFETIFRNAEKIEQFLSIDQNKPRVQSQSRSISDIIHGSTNNKDYGAVQAPTWLLNNRGLEL